MVSTKYKINTRLWVMYNICGFISNLCIACWWCKRSYFWTSWISNVVFPPILTRALCMEYCCHVCAGAPSCYLELLDKQQKRICRIVRPSLVASLEPLAHLWNVASLCLFYRYYFGRCYSELAQLVPLPFSWGRYLKKRKGKGGT